ncbi:MAG: hypothetical protein KBA31_20570 [Alphaproteobacteria bacterium]|nr:hypothetical protein [Alphaproteobacteria bacterium]
MPSRLFPPRIDNDYRGHRLAIWLLAPIMLVKFLMGLNVAGLNPWISNRWIIQIADRIPIESYGAEAASTVMFLFASWGLMLFVLSSLGIAVLIRYRAMIPLMYLLLLIEQFGRAGIISRANPIVRAVKTGDLSFAFLINWGFVALLAIGFALSLGGAGEAISEGKGPA